MILLQLFLLLVILVQTDQDSANVAAFLNSPAITADNATIYNHENFAICFYEWS